MQTTLSRNRHKIATAVCCVRHRRHRRLQGVALTQLRRSRLFVAACKNRDLSLPVLCNTSVRIGLYLTHTSLKFANCDVSGTTISAYNNCCTHAAYTTGITAGEVCCGSQLRRSRSLGVGKNRVLATIYCMHGRHRYILGYMIRHTNLIYASHEVLGIILLAAATGVIAGRYHVLQLNYDTALACFCGSQKSRTVRVVSLTLPYIGRYKLDSTVPHISSGKGIRTTKGIMDHYS